MGLVFQGSNVGMLPPPDHRYDPDLSYHNMFRFCFNCFNSGKKWNELMTEVLEDPCSVCGGNGHLDPATPMPTWASKY